MNERVVDAVRRLGDGWRTSQYLRGHWLNKEFERGIQRPDLIDALIMRKRSRK